MPNDEQRFVLGIAYQAGPSPLIKRGADGHRDYFSPAELEKAAWSFIGSDMIVGVEHVDGTEGHAIIKESYIYRGPDWEITDIAGETVIVKSGDWLLGAVLDEVAWQLHKSGRITGWSPQGSGKRRHRVAKSTYNKSANILTIELDGVDKDTISRIRAVLEGNAAT